MEDDYELKWLYLFLSSSFLDVRNPKIFQEVAFLTDRRPSLVRKMCLPFWKKSLTTMGSFPGTPADDKEIWINSNMHSRLKKNSLKCDNCELLANGYVWTQAGFKILPVSLLKGYDAATCCLKSRKSDSFIKFKLHYPTHSSLSIKPSIIVSKTWKPFVTLVFARFLSFVCSSDGFCYPRLSEVHRLYLFNWIRT